MSIIITNQVYCVRYALDGFPATEEQMLLMGRRGILPIKMIELQLDDDEILHRASNDQSQLEMIEHPFHKRSTYLSGFFIINEKLDIIFIFFISERLLCLVFHLLYHEL